MPEQSLKTWKKPELSVLTRHKPEETVLAACKGYSDYYGIGSEAVANGCIYLLYAACYDGCSTMVTNS